MSDISITKRVFIAMGVGLFARSVRHALRPSTTIERLEKMW